jgi:protease-4
MHTKSRAFTRHRAWFSLALALALAAPCWLGACKQRSAHPPSSKELRTFRVDEPLPESPQQGPFARTPITHYALLERISSTATEPRVSAILLQLGDMGGAWSRAADIADALAEVKRAGKPVHCHFEVTGNLGYALLARACDRISMTPGGYLDLVGVSAQLVYARELLQTVGVSAELIQVGQFKGAADTFTRDDMPEPVAQTMNAILDDLQSEVVTAIAGGRKLGPDGVRALIDRGPFTAAQALAAGLIDDVGFDDEARAHAKHAGKAQRIVVEKLKDEDEELGLGDLLRALSGSDDEDEPTGKRLVLAYLDGTIMRGGEGSFRSSHAEAFVSAMRRFGNDPEVEAVVLRIDSPGGSALASDLMWHAVRRVAKRKPVIVSLGDMAASGGYYVAAAGSEIVAQDQGLVGSIGVVGGKIVAEELSQRVGIHIEQLTRGEHADWMSPVRKWSPDERSVFEASLHETYDRFLMRVAEGRRKQRSQIEPLAEGRLMTARRARAGGLVDHEGGISTAIALARKRAKLPHAAPVEVWPEPPGLLEALSQLTSGDAESKVKAALIEPVLSSVSRAGIVEALLSPEGLRASAVLPYVLSLR